MFGSERFSSHVVRLAPGESLLLYSDGLIEAQDAGGEEYGIPRLSAAAATGILAFGLYGLATAF